MSLTGFLASSAVLLLVLCASPPCHGAWSHNITGVLSAYPEFSAFSAALTSTGVAAEVDNRSTITVLAVDNAAMAAAQGLQPEDLRRAVSLHVLLDYYDDAKLGGLQAGFTQAASLFQASGKAPGSAGIVNITAKQGGRVAFTAEGGAPAPAVFGYEKTVLASPYDIAVLKVNALISSPAAAAAPAPAPGASASIFTDLLSKNGCGGFAALFSALADAKDAYERIGGGGGGGSGITVFCPSDEAVSAFSATFKNLTADAKVSLLLYHGVAAHHSMQSLKAINGEVSTLATDGSKKSSYYNLTVRADGDTVKLSSAAPAAATVTRPLMDKGAVAVYLIDGVLLPRELFNISHSGAAPSPAPVSAPAQAPATPTPAAAPATAPATSAPAPVVAPATAPIPRRRPTEPEMRSPAPTPDEDDKTPADQKSNGARGTASWNLGAAVAAAAVPAMIVLVL